jgi:dCMP deaminase
MIQTEKWDIKYLKLAKYVAENWSKDPSTKVGAVLVNYETGHEFIGYNGFPRGVEDSMDRYNDRELKYKMIVHAEVNAILKAGNLARGASLYVWPSFSIPPICNECAKIAIQSNIKEIIGITPNITDTRFQRWADSMVVSRTMFEEAGITWRMLTLKKGEN